MFQNSNFINVTGCCSNTNSDQCIRLDEDFLTDGNPRGRPFDSDLGTLVRVDCMDVGHHQHRCGVARFVEVASQIAGMHTLITQPTIFAAQGAECASQTAVSCGFRKACEAERRHMLFSFKVSKDREQVANARNHEDCLWLLGMIKIENMSALIESLVSRKLKYELEATKNHRLMMKISLAPFHWSAGFC